MIDDSVILLFIENDADKNNLYKTIDRLGCVCNFEKQKPAELVKRLKSICKRRCCYIKLFNRKLWNIVTGLNK